MAWTSRNGTSAFTRYLSSTTPRIEFQDWTAFCPSLTWHGSTYIPYGIIEWDHFLVHVGYNIDELARRQRPWRGSLMEERSGSAEERIPVSCRIASFICSRRDCVISPVCDCVFGIRADGKSRLWIWQRSKERCRCRAEGYQQISLSGGEPLVYPALLPLIGAARANGFRVTMITNGLFPAKRIGEVVTQLDGMAISFDEFAETHNRMRGRADAFERSCSTLARVAESGRSIAAAISLTRDAVPELPDLADHLVSLGAKALQVRPVALAGRARTMTGISSYSTTDHARLYLVVLALQTELADQARVHCDLAPAKSLWQQRQAYAALLATCAQRDMDAGPDRLLADLVNPLVITETGTLKPIAYDFNPRFDIAAIETLSPEKLTNYKLNGLPNLKSLIGHALTGMENNPGFIDWFDYCTRLSEQR